MHKVIDVSQNVGPYAAAIARAGVQTVMRYYNNQNVNNPTKRLEPEEAAQLTAAGLSLAVVFQQRGGADDHIEDFRSANADRDARRALSLAQGLGQPRGSAIYFGVDWDFVAQSELAAILDYFRAAKQIIGTDYRIGSYGSGKVNRHLLDHGATDLVWLAQSTGWTGYSAMANSGDWALLQGKERLWPERPGFAYDGNLVSAASPDFGQFTLNGRSIAMDAAAGTGSVRTLLRVTAERLNLRGGPGTQFDILRTLSRGEMPVLRGEEGEWLLVDVEGDGRADGYVHRGFVELVAGGFAETFQVGATPFQIAKAELARGVAEIAGDAHNPRIVMYHASTSGGGSTDELPWCSAFVNWCVEKAGLHGTNSKSARSWHDMGWGRSVPENQAREGDIVVWARLGMTSGNGHTGFFVSQDDDSITVLGGNQGNRVSIKSFPRHGSSGGQQYDLLSIRRGAL